MFEMQLKYKSWNNWLINQSINWGYNQLIMLVTSWAEMLNNHKLQLLKREDIILSVL